MENLEKQLRYMYFATILTHLISLWLPSICHSALRPVHAKELVPETRSRASTPTSTHDGHDEGACSRSTLLQRPPGAKFPRLHQRFLAKKYVAQQNFCFRVLYVISRQANFTTHEGACSSNRLVQQICPWSLLPHIKPV